VFYFSYCYIKKIRSASKQVIQTLHVQYSVRKRFISLPGSKKKLKEGINLQFSVRLSYTRGKSYAPSDLDVPKQFRIQVVGIETRQSTFLDLCSYKEVSQVSHTVQKLPI